MYNGAILAIDFKITMALYVKASLKKGEALFNKKSLRAPLQ